MRGLGELEEAAMDVLWRAAGPVRVREVLDRLDTGKKLAYTTVMTVLDNLHRKQYVTRELHGKAYLYQPAFSQEEAAAQALRDVLAASGNPAAVLMHFVASGSESETDILRAALRKRTTKRS